jgi:D-alanyl-D-alanine carboxypeptidase
MKNFNMRMGCFCGIGGMEAGFICLSGFNLAASAALNGRTLAAIVPSEGNAKVHAQRAASMRANGCEHAGRRLRASAAGRT